MKSKITKYKEAVKIAQLRLLEAYKNEFPPGTEVFYEHGNHFRFATVIEWNDSWWIGPRVFVEGKNSSEYSLCGSRIKKTGK